MKVAVTTPGELGPAELDRWRALQAGSPELASPFASAGFAQAVGRVRPLARVAVLESGGAPAGFLGFELNRLGVGRPIGDGVSDGQAVVAAAGLTLDAGTLLAGCGLRTFEFDHLLPAQATALAATAATHEAPLVDLPDGFHAYFEARRAASKRVAQTVRQRRKLERDVGPVWLDPGPHPEAELHRLLDWKSEQYRRTGRPDLFAEPWVRELTAGLLAGDATDCAATLWVLRAGDTPVAAALTLRNGGLMSGWVQAYDVTFGSHSPGWHLVLSLLESAAAQGVQRLDLGRGDQPYKASLKTGDGLVAEGVAARPSTAARLVALRGEPRRRAEAFVLARPRLRLAARRALREVGRVRTGA